MQTYIKSKLQSEEKWMIYEIRKNASELWTTGDRQGTSWLFPFSRDVQPCLPQEQAVCCNVPRLTVPDLHSSGDMFSKSWPCSTCFDKSQLQPAPGIQGGRSRHVPGRTDVLYPQCAAFAPSPMCFASSLQYLRSLVCDGCYMDWVLYSLRNNEGKKACRQ